MKSKRWALSVMGVSFVVLCVIAAVMIVVDPYFHYHAPLKGLSYTMNDSVYTNDGITKNFDYNMVITGDSGTTGFSKVVADELFNAKSIRVTFLGEGFKRINDNLQVALDANDVQIVIRDIGTLFFVTDEDWLGYDEYPEYIYDDDLWNDVYYVLNGEILCNTLIPELVRTIKKEQVKSFDEYIYQYGKVGDREIVLSSYERKPKENKEISEEETEEMFYMLDKNLQKNVIKIVEENPDVTFYLFFPPYSILWWDQFNQSGSGRLERRIQMEQFAIEKILPYDNVRLFSFNAEDELICNLDNYVDDIHYSSDICTQIMVWMKDGKYELTEENYMGYIDNLYEFLCSYDYDAIFEEQ